MADKTTKSLNAFDNLKSICEEHLKGRFTIEVVDIREHPRLARKDQIIAIPTLVLKNPPFSGKRIIGDLSNPERVLAGLGIRGEDNGLGSGARRDGLNRVGAGRKGAALVFSPPAKPAGL